MIQSLHILDRYKLFTQYGLDNYNNHKKRGVFNINELTTNSDIDTTNNNCISIIKDVDNIYGIGKIFDDGNTDNIITHDKGAIIN